MALVAAALPPARPPQQAPPSPDVEEPVLRQAVGVRLHLAGCAAHLHHQPVQVGQLRQEEEGQGGGAHTGHMGAVKRGQAGAGQGLQQSMSQCR